MNIFILGLMATSVCIQIRGIFLKGIRPKANHYMTHSVLSAIITGIILIYNAKTWLIVMWALNAILAAGLTWVTVTQCWMGEDRNDL